MTTLSESIEDADAKVRAGDAQGAFVALRRVLSFPAFSAFANVADAGPLRTR